MPINESNHLNINPSFCGGEGGFPVFFEEEDKNDLLLIEFNNLIKGRKIYENPKYSLYREYFGWVLEKKFVGSPDKLFQLPKNVNFLPCGCDLSNTNVKTKYLQKNILNGQIIFSHTQCNQVLFFFENKKIITGKEALFLPLAKIYSMKVS